MQHRSTSIEPTKAFAGSVTHAKILEKFSP